MAWPASRYSRRHRRPSGRAIHRLPRAPIPTTTPPHSANTTDIAPPPRRTRGSCSRVEPPVSRGTASRDTKVRNDHLVWAIRGRLVTRPDHADRPGRAISRSGPAGVGGWPDYPRLAFREGDVRGGAAGTG